MWPGEPFPDDMAVAAEGQDECVFRAGGDGGRGFLWFYIKVSVIMDGWGLKKPEMKRPS